MSEIADTTNIDEAGDAPVVIRRLAYSDLPEVLAIERRAFPTPWSLAMFALELSKAGGICLAAREAGRGGTRVSGASRGLLGYMVCSRYADVWHLMNVAVDPGRRRERIASALLTALLDAVGLDAKMTLEVRASNTAAIAMYERRGFVSAGHRPRYYQDNGEDAVIMWLGEVPADVPRAAT